MIAGHLVMWWLWHPTHSFRYVVTTMTLEPDHYRNFERILGLMGLMGLVGLRAWAAVSMRAGTGREGTGREGADPGWAGAGWTGPGREGHGRLGNWAKSGLRFCW